MHHHLVGLSVVLEPEDMDYGGSNGNGNGNGNTNNNASNNNRKSIFSVGDTSNNNPSPQVFSKFSVIKAIPLPPPPLPSSPRSSDYTLRGSFGSNFLERCSHCRKIMLPGFDVYMYRGDRGFCTAQCRYEYMFWDEKAMKKTSVESCLYLVKPSSPSSSSPSSGSKNKGKSHK